jgi:hypothetical protein
MPADPRHFPVKLTQAQRKVVAQVAPGLAGRLKLGERNQRTIAFTLAGLKALKGKAGRAMRRAAPGMVPNALRHVTGLTAQAPDLAPHPGEGRHARPAPRAHPDGHGLDQRPPAPVPDRGQLDGDPLLVRENFGEAGYADSTAAKRSDTLGRPRPAAQARPRPRGPRRPGES